MGILGGIGGSGGNILKAAKAALGKRRKRAKPIKQKTGAVTYGSGKVHDAKAAKMFPRRSFGAIAGAAGTPRVRRSQKRKARSLNTGNRITFNKPKY
jgi:hypothetical protein